MSLSTSACGAPIPSAPSCWRWPCCRCLRCCRCRWRCWSILAVTPTTGCSTSRCQSDLAVAHSYFERVRKSWGVGWKPWRIQHNWSAATPARQRGWHRAGLTAVRAQRDLGWIFCCCMTQTASWWPAAHALHAPAGLEGHPARPAAASVATAIDIFRPNSWRSLTPHWPSVR